MASGYTHSVSKDTKLARRAELDARLADPVELLAEICEFVANGAGQGLRAYAEQAGISYRALGQWIKSDPDREAALEAAREYAADQLAEEQLGIVDQPLPVDERGRGDAAEVNSRRLRVETRQWLAGCLSKKYRARSEIDVQIGPAIDIKRLLFEREQQLERLILGERVE